MCKKYLTKPREIRDTERIKKECPYHELDDVKTYEEYLQKTDKNGLAKILEMLG